MTALKKIAAGVSGFTSFLSLTVVMVIARNTASVDAVIDWPTFAVWSFIVAFTNGLQWLAWSNLK